MTRGNQREIARAKNQKKLQEHMKKKDGHAGKSLEDRKARDADIMRQKQAKKEAEQAAGAGAAAAKK